MGELSTLAAAKTSAKKATPKKPMAGAGKRAGTSTAMSLKKTAAKGKPKPKAK